MKTYSEILKLVNDKKKKSSLSLPHGFTLLYRGENNQLQQYQNFSPNILKNLDEQYERHRQKELYMKTMRRLVKYRIHELNIENKDYNIEEILDYWGYYDNNDNENTSDGCDDYYSGESDSNSD